MTTSLATFTPLDHGIRPSAALVEVGRLGVSLELPTVQRSLASVPMKMPSGEHAEILR
jgi:hypothetical protein